MKWNRRVALASALFPSRDEGAPGPFWGPVMTAEQVAPASWPAVAWTSRSTSYSTRIGEMAGGPLITVCVTVPHSSRLYRDERVFGQGRRSPQLPFLAPGIARPSASTPAGIRITVLPHHRWLRRINLLRRTIGDWGCGGKLSRRRGHTPYPPSHIFKTLQ
jgi:hypothetical protein